MYAIGTPRSIVAPTRVTSCQEHPRWKSSAACLPLDAKGGGRSCGPPTEEWPRCVFASTRRQELAGNATYIHLRLQFFYPLLPCCPRPFLHDYYCFGVRLFRRCITPYAPPPRRSYSNDRRSVRPLAGWLSRMPARPTVQACVAVTGNHCFQVKGPTGSNLCITRLSRPFGFGNQNIQAPRKRVLQPAFMADLEAKNGGWNRGVLRRQPIGCRRSLSF